MQGLKPGTRVKISEMSGEITSLLSKDGYAMYRVKMDGGIEVVVPSGFTEAVFEAEDGAVYQDADGDVFVYREYDDLFVMVICNGRADSDGDTFSYDGLCKPVTKIASTQRRNI